MVIILKYIHVYTFIYILTHIAILDIKNNSNITHHHPAAATTTTTSTTTATTTTTTSATTTTTTIPASVPRSRYNLAVTLNSLTFDSALLNTSSSQYVELRANVSKTVSYRLLCWKHLFALPWTYSHLFLLYSWIV